MNKYNNYKNNNDETIIDLNLFFLVNYFGFLCLIIIKNNFRRKGEEQTIAKGN